jgi:hypothetical protein
MNMQHLDNASLLEQLIVTAELTLQMRSTRAPEFVAELAQSVDDAYARATDIVRVIDIDTLIFMQALGEATLHLRSYQHHRAARYLRVIGVLLPEIREAFSVAIEQRKRPTA